MAASSESDSSESDGSKINEVGEETLLIDHRGLQQGYGCIGIWQGEGCLVEKRKEAWLVVDSCCGGESRRL
jgi:hypothetical protein